MSAAQVRAAVEDAFRDFEVAGVPSSGEHEPVKSEIRYALGALLEQVLSSIGAGLKRYATRALLYADTDEADGTLAYVYDDATAAYNTVYQWNDAGNAWEVADWYFNAVAGVVQPLLDATEDARDEAIAVLADGLGIVSPFLVAPAYDHPLYRVEDVKFYRKSAAGLEITVPAQIQVREIASDALNRIRFRFADQTGTVFASETYPDAGNIPDTGYTGRVRFPLYASTGVTGVPAGTQIGEVLINFRDGATFGNYNVPYAWPTGALRPEQVDYAPALYKAIDDGAAEQVRAHNPLFLAASNDEYARRWCRDARFTGMDADDVPYFNYETAYFPGIPLYRVQIDVYSTKLGRKIGYGGYSSATNPVAYLKERGALAISNMADGSHVYTDDGIDGLMFFDWDAVEWTTKPKTTYVDASATGLNIEGRVLTPDGQRAAFRAPATSPYLHLTVGATNGQFETIVDAIDYLTNPAAAATVSRSTYPASDRCTPARPALIEVVDANHQEEVIPYTYLGIGQSPLRLPHGCILRTRPDTLIYMDSASTEPVIEMNFTARLEGGGLVRQDGTGYVVHVDNSNGISDVAPDGSLRRKIQTMFGDIRLLTNNAANIFPCIGSGLSDGQDYVCDGTDIRHLGNGAFVGIHTSPGCVVPGNIYMLNVTTNAAARAPGIASLQLGKTNAQDIRHNVYIENSEMPVVSYYSSGGGVGGVVAFVRRGSWAGVTTYDAGFNP